ncbi:SagB/ThcOx family dehydrogenase [Allohahella marinimesophila]|uniref:SagB/ThcOx family dehydrogenase n=1 Tax=Allohahella marinimesophila TaxID=1054972 RepID=A0ABP7NFN3_9GAMM
MTQDDTQRSPTVQLTLPNTYGVQASELRHALEARHSQREFSDTPIALADLAAILWAGQGAGTTPSAASQYPLQLHVAAARVDELEAGVYCFNASAAHLSVRRADDVLGDLEAATLGDQPWVGQAAAVLLVSADLGAMREHFNDQPPQGERGFRYAYMEAGAALQNIGLMTAALGLGGVIVGGFDDAVVSNIFELSEAQRPVALYAAGVIDQST